MTTSNNIGVDVGSALLAEILYDLGVTAAVLEDIIALHHETPTGYSDARFVRYCAECRKPYPCPTIIAMGMVIESEDETG